MEGVHPVGGAGGLPGMDPGALSRLEEARAAERGQTRFYRSLALEAGLAGDAAAEERLNELHADEQHHLARLTARILELGVDPAPLDEPAAAVPWPLWEEEARRREQAEVARYEALLVAGGLDPHTVEIVREILATERLHARDLGGKWVPAAPGGEVG